MAELVEPQVSRYPVYKPTGVEWLPEIPAGWEVKKLKHCFKFSVGGTPTTSKQSYFEGENTWVTIADMQQRVIIESKTSLSDDALVAAGMEVVPEGSLLYSFKLSVGKVAFAGKDLHTNEAIFSVLPSPAYDLTYFYFALPELLIHSAGQNIYGAKIFNQELLKNAFIALPPLAEQRAITTFLDDKTAQLDQLITYKQQMLELLREERAALINHAVTKGLDGAASLRDSGVEWLGEVPAHWEVKRLKFISPSISVGLVINPSTYHDDNGTVPMISGKNVTENGIDIRDVKFITEESSKALLPSKLNAGDLVSIRVGYPGLTAVVPEELDGINCASVMIIRKGPGFHSPFLSMLMNSQVGAQQVDVVAYGSAQKQFNVGHAIEFVFPLPPLKEQLAISEEVNKRERKIAETAATINQEIALLQEYRAALIAEAVTGQLDVRHYIPASVLT
jgi:type I restriction enzyme S subunit